MVLCRPHPGSPPRLEGARAIRRDTQGRGLSGVKRPISAGAVRSPGPAEFGV